MDENEDLKLDEAKSFLRKTVNDEFKVKVIPVKIVNDRILQLISTVSKLVLTVILFYAV